MFALILLLPKTTLVVPDQTDRTPIARHGNPDLNWPDHDQADPPPTPRPMRLAGSAQSRVPDQPRLSHFSHHSRLGRNAKKGKIWQNIMALGNLEQAISEGFWTLFGSARSGCGVQNESGRCRSPDPSPSSFSMRVWRADRFADPGKQRTPWSGYN